MKPCPINHREELKEIAIIPLFLLVFLAAMVYGGITWVIERFQRER